MMVVAKSSTRPPSVQQDTQSLFRKALPYFVIAIADTLRHHVAEHGQKPITPSTIHETWSREAGRLRNRSPKLYLLADPRLFDAAVAVCAEFKLIEPLLDDFGPPTFLIEDDFATAFSAIEAAYPLFRKFDKAGRSWLMSALQNISIQREKEAPADKVKGSQDFFTKKGDQDFFTKEGGQDFFLKDRSPPEGLDEWRPLPVDRADPRLAKVEEALDRAIEAVRADNGYSATHPGERQYILSTLISFREVLKREAQITLGYVRLCALDPLGRAIQTLGNSASGTLLSVAKDLLKDWLKEVGKDLFS